MDTISILGFSAAALTTISFLPQVLKCFKTKRTKDISLPAFVTLGTGVFLWFIYGILTGQAPVWLANGITGILVVSILVLKIKHG